MFNPPASFIGQKDLSWTKENVIVRIKLFIGEHTIHHCGPLVEKIGNPRSAGSFAPIQNRS